MGEGQSKLLRSASGSLQSSRESLGSQENMSNPKVEFIKKSIKNIRKEIQLYTGDRLDSKYTAFQVTLTNFSKELQDIRINAKKKKARLCENIQRDITDCLRLLEEKIDKQQMSNETNEESDTPSEIRSSILVTSKYDDESTISSQESSPIPSNGCPNKSRRNSKGKHLRFDEIVMKELDIKISRIKKDIDEAIRLELRETFPQLEKQIQDYYTELELIKINPILKERKETLCNTLIKYNNKLRKYKSLKKETKQPKTETTPIVATITEIEQAMIELEPNVNNFQGIKNGDNYKSLFDTLSDYKLKLYCLEVNQEFKEYRDRVMNKTIDMLRILEEKVKETEILHENQNKFKENVRSNLEIIKEAVDSFIGKQTDEAYIFLDQNLRKLWDKLNTIENDKTNFKTDTVEEIKEYLKILKGKVADIPQECNLETDGLTFSKFKIPEIQLDSITKNEEKCETMEEVIDDRFDEIIDETINEKIDEVIEEDIYETIEKDQLSNKIKEYENQWQQLLLPLSEIILSETILEQLERISIDMDKKIKEMRRKSNIIYLEPQKKNEPIYAVIQKKWIEPIETETVEKLQPIVEVNETPTNLNTEIDASPIVEVKRSYTFSDLRKIQKEVNDLSRELFYDQERPENLKEKLSEQKNKLVVLEFNENPLLEETKTKILKNIDDTFNLLDAHVIYLNNEVTRTSLKQEKEENAIKEMETVLQNIKNEINDFPGVIKDNVHKKIEDKLGEVFQNIQKLNFKDENTKKLAEIVKNLTSELSDKLKTNQKMLVQKQSSEEINELKTIIEDVQNLRKNFEECNNDKLKEQFRICLKKIDSLDDRNNEKAQVAKVKIRQKILQYLNELDKDDSEKQISSIKGCETVYGSIRKEAKTKDTHPSIGDRSFEVQNQTIHSSINNRRLENQPEMEITKILENFAVPSRINSVLYNEEQNETILETKQLQTKSKAEIVHLPLTHPESPYQKIENIRHELIDIKAKMDCFKGAYKDTEYNLIEDQIFQCNERLNKINDNGSTLIRTSKSQYQDYTKKLLKYFEVTVSGIENRERFLNPKAALDEIMTAKDNMKKLRDSIRNFDGDLNTYVLIKEDLLAEKVRMEYLEFKNNAEMNNIKEETLKEILKLLKKLKTKANRNSLLATQETESVLLEQIALNLKLIEEKITSFIGIKNDPKYTELDEALISLVIKTDQIEVEDNQALKEKKSQLIYQLQKNLNLLHDKTLVHNKIIPHHLNDQSTEV